MVIDYWFLHRIRNNMRHRRLDMQNLRLVLLNHVLRLSEIELTSDLIIDKLGLARNYEYSRFNFCVFVNFYIVTDSGISQEIEIEIGWLTSHSMVFQSYMWRRKAVQADWRRNSICLRPGSQHHRHFVGFLNVSVQTPTRGRPFYTVIPRNWPF